MRNNDKAVACNVTGGGLMAENRVPKLAGFYYKGGAPMWSWMLHRVTGVAMVVFIGLHVIASFALQNLGSDLGKAINIIFQGWLFQAFIYFSVIFHVLNGARVIVLDTFPRLIPYQRETTWLQWLIFIPVYGLALLFLVFHGITGG
jgi:succinate dehydrogenase / fumarate reductase cytochrome b subunit